MKSFHGKSTFYAVGIKKTNFDATIRLFTRHFFNRFYVAQIKMPDFRETLCFHIKYRDLCTNFFVMIFGHFKMCFLGIESICTWEPN